MVSKSIIAKSVFKTSTFCSYVFLPHVRILLLLQIFKVELAF